MIHAGEERLRELPKELFNQGGDIVDISTSKAISTLKLLLLQVVHRKMALVGNFVVFLTFFFFVVPIFDL